MREMPPVEDLGNGMWSVPVPIPNNPLRYTLVYVLEGPRGPLLIDAGWQHEDSWAALTSGLESIGTRVEDVTGVVITHFHPDHAGLAGRVRAASGAWLAMHHADIEMLRYMGSVNATSTRQIEMEQLRRAGADQETLRVYAEINPYIDPPAIPDRELNHGELIDLPDRKLRVVWTPGHSPGHICLHLEDSDHLFTGDHVLPRITPHISLYPFDLSALPEAQADPAAAQESHEARTPADDERDPLGTFLDSLSQVSEIGAAHALPAHEQRFSDVAARTTEIIDHHEDRLTALHGMLGSGSSSLWELTAALGWSQKWADMHAVSRRMAAAETAAHLRTLERRGLATRDDETGVLLYRQGAAPHPPGRRPQQADPG